MELGFGEYMFVIEPDGTGYYFDFTNVSPGEALEVSAGSEYSRR